MRRAGVLVPGLLLGAVLAMLALSHASRRPETPRPEPGSEQVDVLTTAPGRALGLAPAAADGGLERRAMEEPDPHDFAAFVDRLVRLGLALDEAVRAGRDAEARSRDAEAKELCGRIVREVADFDARALHALAGCPVEDQGQTAQVRRRVLAFLVAQGLARRAGRDDRQARRAGLDALVRGIVTLLPRDEMLARELAPLLVGQPYLGPAHETDLLELADLAREQAWLVPAAVELLRTLWDNLEHSGARGASELLAAALLALEDGNPVRRLAALERLLRRGEERHREAVVQQILQRRDRQGARAVAIAAAQHLPPADAFAILRRLADVEPQALMPGFLTLGGRDAGFLRGRYEELLGNDVEPRLRAELITGAGFQGSSEDVLLAQTAFDLDRDPGVRERALFVLTARAGTSLGPAALDRALDDPGLSGRPEQLGQIVLALENLAHSGDPGVVARIGTRILARQGLLPGDRSTLERLLERNSPGGAWRTPR